MNIPAFLRIRPVLLAGVLASWPAVARAAAPCCGISGINGGTGVVTGSWTRVATARP